MEMLEEAVSAYEGAVTPEMAQYLYDRGVTREAAVTHRLGYVREPHPGHEWYQGMVAIPYLTRDGKPLALRFHCMEQHDHRAEYHGKYNSMKGEPTRLYGVRDIFEAKDTIHATEGEFDRLVLKRMGVPVVGVPGSETFTWHHAKMLAGYSRIWLWADPDEAGSKLLVRMSGLLRQTKVVRLEQDVTDTWKAGGDDALKDILQQLR